MGGYLLPFKYVNALSTNIKKKNPEGILDWELYDKT